MKKLIVVLLLSLPSISSASVMKSYRLVWDTGKIASFGMGFGYNIFNTSRPREQFEGSGRNVRLLNDNVLGPTLEAEVGITGYEYLAGIKFGKMLNRARNTYIFTIFTGKSENWIDLKTNIKKDHYVFGVRICRKFNTLAIKYHTDLDKEKMISIQLGIGE